ncbi:MAG: ClpXP protease specificity-enhancing factor SspB [Mesosutterella sp.]|nr:ClpXP protease specificity-enhancing factor SspB [Mesosutterella sp.]
MNDTSDFHPAVPLKPYLIRAMVQWCEDNGLRPYLVIQVDDGVQVPREYVRDGQIVLNVSAEAAHNADFGNEEITFAARFGMQASEIRIPVRAVIAAYPAECPEAGFCLDYKPAADAQPVQTGSGKRLNIQKIK